MVLLDGTCDHHLRRQKKTFGPTGLEATPVLGFESILASNFVQLSYIEERRADSVWGETTTSQSLVGMRHQRESNMALRRRRGFRGWAVFVSAMLFGFPSESIRRGAELCRHLLYRQEGNGKKGALESGWICHTSPRHWQKTQILWGIES